jgi:hypothetical protein
MATSKPRVIVVVEGGVIQDIVFDNCPPDLLVEVRDFDTEGAVEGDMGTAVDDNGQLFYRGEWTP